MRIEKRFLVFAFLFTLCYVCWFSTTIHNPLTFSLQIPREDTPYYNFESLKHFIYEEIIHQNHSSDNKIFTQYATSDFFDDISLNTTSGFNKQVNWEAVIYLFNSSYAFANKEECIEFYREKMNEYLHITPQQPLTLPVPPNSTKSFLRQSTESRYKFLQERKKRILAEYTIMGTMVRREYVLVKISQRNCNVTGREVIFSTDSLSYPKPYFFVHLPKTGGTTLSGLALNNEGGDKTKFWQIWQHPDSEGIATIPTRSTIFGHFYYGLHHYLPEPYKSTYITFLRHPVDRVISLYNYHKQEGEKLARRYPLPDWLDKDPDFCNQMTKHLSGIKNYTRSEEMLVLAKHHLINHFRFVGITEFFNESVVLMKLLLNFSNIDYVYKNPSMSGKEMNTTSDVKEKIARCAWMDMEIYKLGKQLFMKQIEEAGYENFAREFQNFIKNYQFRIDIPKRKFFRSAPVPVRGVVVDPRVKASIFSFTRRNYSTGDRILDPR